MHAPIAVIVRNLIRTIKYHIIEFYGINRLNEHFVVG